MVEPAEETGLSGRTAIKPNVAIKAKARIHVFLDFIIFLSVKEEGLTLRWLPSLGLGARGRS